MKILSKVYLLTLALAFSTSINAAELVDIKTMPKWFQKAFSKDKKVKKTSTLKIEKLGVDASIKGKITGEDISEDVWYYTIKAGSDSPVECYTFTEFDGPATSLKNVVEASLSNVAVLNNKPLTGRQTFSLETEVFESGTSYIGLNIFYLVGSGETAAAGLLKSYVAQTGDTLQMCIHNDIGYHKAFFNVFQSYVAAFDKPNDDNLFFSQVTRVKINDIPVGFGFEAHLQDNEGDVKAYSDISMLIPVSDKDLLAMDSILIEWSRPNGTVINVETQNITGGEFKYYYTLQNDGQNWVVKGHEKGAEVKYTLDHTGGLLSHFGVYGETIRLANLEENSAEYLMWEPDIDPKLVVSNTLTASKTESGYDSILKQDAMLIESIHDSGGAMTSSDIAIEGLNLRLEQLFAKGKPSL